ncbi:LamG-like jellyroll fold domain-containing protein, partial [Armatimonas sp.]|uniref:LamG domain-containing protein n=1 Tax=Armatimonas sp. TaxID=1872638 RepID=UPI00286BC2C3
LYAGNSSAGGVDAWTSVQSDSASKTAATRTYTTSTTPALRSNTVNSLAATVATSTAQAGSNTLAIGHSLGVDTIDEHSTQASSGISYYTREGTTGTSGYSQKNFGGAIFTKLITTNSVVKASMSSYSNSNITIEMLYNPTTIAPAGSPHRFLYTNGGNCAGNNIEIYLGGGSIPTICTQSTNVAAVSALASANVWYHLVFQITAGVPSIYVNGVQQSLSSSPTYSSGTVSATSNTFIGGRGVEGGASCSQCTVAYYDEFRLSNTARYSSNFTPSKTPFTTDANTVALYHLNERDGQTIYDSSSNANNGTLGATSSVASDDPLRVIPAISGASDNVSAVGLTKAGGTARGMSFDGTNDYISTPNSSTTNVTSTAITLSSWFKYTAIPSTVNLGAALIGKGGYDTFTGYELLFQNSSGAPRFQFNISTGGSSGTLNYVPTLTPNTWYHVVAVYSSNASVAKWIYLNGVLVASGGAQLGSITSSASYPLGIGRRDPADNYAAYLNGSIANARVYTAAFSATDVTNLYNAELAGRTFDGYSGNLVGYWKLDERTGQNISDSSGSGNNGTFGATSSVASDDPTPTIAGPGLTQSPTLWVATNGAGSDDGAVTSISQPNDRQEKVYLTTNSDLPDLDVTSLSMSSGGLAFVGTENGGWSTGTGGAPELTNGVRQGAMHIRGATRITGATRVSR